MNIRPIIIMFLVICSMIMPVLAADDDNKPVIIDKDGNVVESRDSEITGSSKNIDKDVETEEIKTDSNGFNKLLMAPVTGVNYLMNIPPAEKAILLVVGCAIGISVIITLISFAVNNGRIGWGSIWGRWETMLKGRNWMGFVFLGFCGFLLALALMKYLGTASVF